MLVQIVAEMLEYCYMHAQIVQGLLEEHCQQAEIPEELKTSSVEVQVSILPISRDAQTQVAPEKRHIGK